MESDKRFAAAREAEGCRGMQEKMESILIAYIFSSMKAFAAR